MDPALRSAYAILRSPRARSPWFCAAALLALLVALTGPLEALAEVSLAAHMVQHTLLIGFAAPMLALAYPRPLLRPLPVTTKKALGAALRRLGGLVRPRPAFVLHAVAIWLAHVPRIVEWAATYHWVHALEHVVLLGTAAAFWWALLRPRAVRSGEAPVLALAMLIHTGLLGALLALSPRPLYPGFGLEDQQLAGLIMWVPGGLCYLAAGIALAAAWVPRGE
jgi:putative membrane protein